MPGKRTIEECQVTRLCFLRRYLSKLKEYGREKQAYHVHNECDVVVVGQEQSSTLQSGENDDYVRCPNEVQTQIWIFVCSNHSPFNLNVHGHYDLETVYKVRMSSHNDDDDGQ